MRTTIRTGLLVLILAAVMSACGDSGDDELRLPPAPSETPTTTSGTPDPTPAPVTTTTPASEGRSCSDILSDGVALARSYSLEARGVAGPPDVGPYRAKAQALLSEARELGCPVPPGIEDFIP